MRLFKKRKHKLEVYLNGKLVLVNKTGFSIETDLDKTTITIPDDYRELLDDNMPSVKVDKKLESYEY